MKGQAGQLKEKKVSGFISQVPNLLSLSRIIVGYVIGALLFSNYEKRMSAALMCYIVGSVTDYLDGKTARAFGVVSTFGALFDSLCDKIMVLSVEIVFIAVGLYPPWFSFGVILVLTRDFLVSGLRMLAATKEVVLSAEKAGKVKAFVEMVAMTLTLFSGAMRERNRIEVLVRLSELLGKAGFVASCVLTATSGIGYYERNKHLFSS